EVVVEEVKVDKDTTKTVIKNKKQYKKLHKPKEEIITLQTREIDGDSQTDVTIEELIPDDISDILKGEVLEEFPSTTEITEDLSGPTPIVTKVTKRKTQKRVGEKAQVTEIVVTEKGNETPITEVNVYLTDEVPRVTEESVDTITIEVPEEITTKVIQTPTGPKIETTKTRILKKLKSPKQETLIVETVYEEDKIPETTVTADEAKDLSALPESTQVLEMPEKITIDKTSKKTMKRIIHKKKGDKIETTKICTVEEDDRKPQTTVTTFTSEISELPPDETLKLLEVLTPKKLKKKPITPHFELETTDVHTIEHTQELGEVSEDLPKVIGTVIQDVRESVTIETVMSQKPVEDVPLIEELPEEIEVIEAVAADGKKKKKIIKKRTIRKRIGDTREDTHIVTIEEEGKLPQSTVTIEEIEVPDTKTDEFLTPSVEEVPYIEELPEEIIETEVDSLEGPKKKTFKKRTLKKRRGSKVETTEIFTVQEEGKEPQTSVTIQDVTEEESKLTDVLPEKQEKAVLIEELPEEINIDEVQSRWGPKKRTTKKRIIRKRVGDKQEETQIVTVEEEGKEPLTTVTIDEIDLPSDKVRPLQILKPGEDVAIEEIPEQVIITTVDTLEGPKKKVIKKKVFKKKVGDKEQATEILTVEEEGKPPEVSVVVKETVEEEKKVKKLKKPKKATSEQVQVTEEGYLFVPSLAQEKIKAEGVEDMIQMELLKTALSKQIPSFLPGEDEDEVVEETVSKRKIKKIIKKKKPKIEDLDIESPLIAEELPEEIQVVETVNKEGIAEKKIIRKRVIKKHKGDIDEITTISTVEEENKVPQSTITIEEVEAETEKPSSDCGRDT
ncbi:hypothetical protein D910_05907, partial [Dendroctonus ponderosae]